MIYYSVFTPGQSADESTEKYLEDSDAVRDYLRELDEPEQLDQVIVTRYKVRGPISKPKLMKILNMIGYAEECREVTDMFAADIQEAKEKV